jgi:holo-[acyl-carrier protein] synthase
MKDPHTILGIGTDIIEIERIAMSLNRHGDQFLKRIFTPKEQEYAAKFKNSDGTLAGRFAAKEAVAKALGTGIREDIGWKDIEILNDEQGRPYVTLADHLKVRFQNPHILISISHSKSYATAFAIWQPSHQ